MKVSILAFALGATASFTKVVRQEKPIATLEMHMNSACLTEEPYATTELSNGVCKTLDSGYGSFKVKLDDSVDVANCMSEWTPCKKKKMHRTEKLMALPSNPLR